MATSELKLADKASMHLAVNYVSRDPALTQFPIIAGTHWSRGQLVYVRDVPHKIKSKAGLKSGYKLIPEPGFADWEYTDSREHARPLSRYWWRRFKADRHHCSQCAHWWADWTVK